MKNFHHESLFWALFLAFNFALFAYNYFIQAKNMHFFPFSLKGLKKGKRGVFISRNMDFFRFSIEVSLIILLYRFNVLERGGLFFSLFYCFLFVFNIYHFSFAYIYKTLPVIANDIKLLRDGIAILYNESKIRFFIYAAGLMVLSALIFLAFSKYLSFSLQLKPLPVTYVISTVLLLVFFVAIVRKGIYKNRLDNAYRFLFQLARLVAHVVNSRKLLRNNSRFKKTILSQNKIGVREKKLINRPNIYFIFIESYGSLLVKEEKVRSGYLDLQRDFTSQLKESGWGIKSDFAESVTLIGPSWLACSSFFYGWRIENHLVYEYLLRNKSFHSTESLLNFLKNNSYTVFNLNPTKKNKALTVPMDDLTSFYHVDQWILRDDINYKGLEYGFGEFPADQYTLNYAYENYLKKTDSPFVLFYLTKNSHSPFVSPKKPLDDWKKVNSNNRKNHSMTGGFLKRPNLDDFMDSMEYQIKVIQKFILDNGKDNDIFLLMGDHQPHEISSEDKHGLETIVHIVSKNKDFLNGFESYGFRDSLYDDISPVKHEGLHSAFLRELLRCYGDSNGKLPDYQPDGVQLL